MDKVRKLWIPVLLGVLLIAVMVGVAGAGRNNRPHAALGPTAYIMVPAAAFNPIDEGADWYNYGNSIYNQSTSTGFFLAGPIVFPYAGTVQITEMVLVAEDSDTGLPAYACVRLYRNLFSTGGQEWMAGVCSTGSAPGVRKFTTTTISPARVNPKWYGCHLNVELGPSTVVVVHSVRIAYRPVL